MNKKILISAALAAVMCVAMTACGSDNSSSSSSKAEDTTTTTTTTAAAESTADATAESSADSAAANVGTTDYDVDGDFRAFEQLKDKYKDGYLANLTGQMSGNGTNYTICVKDGKAYQAYTVQGMKSYTVCPGDGKLYNVSEGTTTYSVEEDDGNEWKSADVLFGATLDFDHAYIDEATNTVLEYYKLDSDVTGAEGMIIYGFNGATYDLQQIAILPDGADETSAIYYTVDSIGEADEDMLTVPDLSAYDEE